MSLEMIMLCDMCSEEIPEGDLFGKFSGAHVHDESGSLDLCEKCSDKVQAHIMGGSGATQKQRDAVDTLKRLGERQDIGCTEAVNFMEAAFGVDGIHELLAKLCDVLEGGRL